jgi:TatD DNase family protein
VFINVHSHFACNQPNTVTLQSLYAGYALTQQPGHYTVGIHPWYITDLNTQLQQLQQHAGNVYVRGIGECGLDTLCLTDMALQQAAFEAQLQLAAALHKPVIIHCVRAWQPLLHTLKTINPPVPIIFHGYNKSLELALELTNMGYYLSFGKALLHQRIQTVFKHLPLQQLLLETDDADMPVSNLYFIAAKACNLSVDSFSLQLQQNAGHIFGNTLFDV